MNPQERALLETFLDQLVQIHGIHKVPQADAMIRHAVERQPDAAYLLVQRSLMQQQALEQAKSRIAELELAEQDTERSFLDGGPSNASVPIAPAAAARAAAQGAPAGRAGWPSQAPGAPGAGSPLPEPPRGMGPTGSFLGQAAATAAGVAGGAFLFQGIEDLLGAHGGSFAGHEATAAALPEDVTINNYYGSDEGRDRAGEERTDEFADADQTPDSDSDSPDDGGDFV
jgi:hypothetical protein